MRSQMGVVPLATGNIWKYDGVEYDTSGRVTETFGEVNRVTSDILIFGYHLFDYDGRCVINTDSGLVWRDPFSPDTSYRFDTYLQYPTHAGASYQLFGDDVHVASAHTLITISIGSFHCVQYQTYMDGQHTTDWYVCPNLGIIKSVSHFASNYPAFPEAVQSVEELHSYTIL